MGHACEGTLTCVIESSVPRGSGQPHLADVHGIQLGQQDLGQVCGLRVMMLHVFSLFPVQPLWRGEGVH